MSNAWGASFGASWGASWGGSGATAPAAGSRRFVLPREMAIAAKRLAEDRDALLIVEALLASDVLQ